MVRALSPITHYTTKSEAVYRALREAIVSGTMPQGRRLVTRQVAASLGVSESPVREALRHLATEGFVRLTPHVGAVVTEILDQDLEEVLLMRAALEGMAARLAAERVSNEEMKVLEGLIGRMDGAQRRRAVDEYRRLNRRFHRTISAAAGRTRLLKAIDDLAAQSERSQAAFHLIPRSTSRSNHEHRQLLAALRRRDGEAAEAITRRQKYNTVSMLRQAARGRTGELPRGGWNGRRDGAGPLR